MHDLCYKPAYCCYQHLLVLPWLDVLCIRVDCPCKLVRGGCCMHLSIYSSRSPSELHCRRIDVPLHQALALNKRKCAVTCSPFTSVSYSTSRWPDILSHNRFERYSSTTVKAARPVLMPADIVVFQIPEKTTTRYLFARGLAVGRCTNGRIGPTYQNYVNFIDCSLFFNNQ